MLDLSLYLITDRACLGGRPLEEAVEQAIRGGCTLVQLREKERGGRVLYERALRVKAVTDRYGVPLLINDRVDIALAVDAAGVHLGQGDLPARAVRPLLRGKWLGVSAATREEALQAQADGADYLGVGALFPTRTKPDATFVPPEELLRIREAVNLPIVGIGGIHADTITQLRGTGLNGVAVASALLAAPDVVSQARALRALWAEGSSERVPGLGTFQGD